SRIVLGAGDVRGACRAPCIGDRRVQLARNGPEVNDAGPAAGAGEQLAVRREGEAVNRAVLGDLALRPPVARRDDRDLARARADGEPVAALGERDARAGARALEHEGEVTGLEVEDAHRAVVARGGEPGAVGREGEPTNGVAMPGERAG